jgi:hypothetical protein
VTESLETSSWPSRVKVVLPSRAFLLSWREQTIPARQFALKDAEAYAGELVADPGADPGQRDMALLAAISEAMQPLEDFAYLATAWDDPFAGLASYVRATVYSARTPSLFWQRMHKRDDAFFDVLAAFSARDSSTGNVHDILDRLGVNGKLTGDQLKVLGLARERTRRRLRQVLSALAQEWQQHGPYFNAYKHGGLIANRHDATWVDDDTQPVGHQRHHEPAIAIWHRSGKRLEGRGEFKLSAQEVVKQACAMGRMAIEFVDAFVESRLSVFDAVHFNPDGTVRSLTTTQLPWTIWLREADLPPEAWDTLGRGPRINWVDTQDPTADEIVIDG